MSVQTTAQDAISQHPGLLDWLLHGETGISSKTIVSVLTGHVLDGYQSEPYDPSDFRRCELLLRHVFTLRILLPVMRERSDWWAGLVDHWDEIVALMQEEVPGIFDTSRPSGSAPRSYALIKSLRGTR